MGEKTEPVVDPDVERPEPSFHPGGGRLDLIGVRHVGGQNQPLATRRLEAVATSGEQMPREHHAVVVASGSSLAVKVVAPRRTAACSISAFTSAPSRIATAVR